MFQSDTIVERLQSVTTAEQVFGSRSILVDAVQDITAHADEGGVLYNMIAIAIVVWATYLILGRRRDMERIVEFMRGDVVRNVTDPRTQLHGIIWRYMILGALTGGIVAQAAAIYYGTWVVKLPEWILPYMPIVITIGIIMLWGVQAGIMRLAGTIWRRDKVLMALLIFKWLSVSWVAIITAPIAIVMIVLMGGWVKWVGLVMGAVMAIWITYLIVNSFRLFARHKISGLFCFLYLCGVELLPIAAIVALIASAQFSFV